ncbi:MULTISPECIES: S9 family peptidase [unclassified Treponema]|uniref:alpha/beta hydrolase family protein n=1 Tax=unclassified Treponema TaxID=2638727 RepID=UPI0020A2C751|nr:MULTISPECIES: alpha/beta fold hydrolase [unclassified Treponema]UTC66652.1 alpha/beta hydrolase [Treponema sp. OMZ 789]UTC69384.1 alpha/beta hydrolase [Treponema sp. OMZ 790]UTC72099.1 alpha/beta hydrolase [Treponema sp. OMZ 791]
MKRKRKLILWIAALVLLIFFIVPMGIAYFMYKDIFSERYTTASHMKRQIEEFKGLKLKQYFFTSNKGQKLTAYKYYKEDSNYKGLIIIAHGLGGGGHNSYMDVADYLAGSGYLIFSYDATGNDESEGSGAGGLPQGIIDLDYAIRFVKENEEFKNLPIMLFGHSWGGYSVGSVLNVHKDIAAVVMAAGFNSSISIIRDRGADFIGKWINFFIPYFSLIEKIKFGRYAKYSCINGFENSNTKIMLIHSSDDDSVSFENNYKEFYKKFKDNSRFTFIDYNNRGHNYLYYTDEARAYGKKLNEDFKVFKNTLQVELTSEIRSDYFKEHLDKKRFFEIDKKLMEKIVTFYDENSTAELLNKYNRADRDKKNKQAVDAVFKFIYKKSLAENDIKELSKKEIDPDNLGFNISKISFSKNGVDVRFNIDYFLYKNAGYKVNITIENFVKERLSGLFKKYKNIETEFNNFFIHDPMNNSYSYTFVDNNIEKKYLYEKNILVGKPNKIKLPEDYQKDYNALFYPEDNIPYGYNIGITNEIPYGRKAMGHLLELKDSKIFENILIGENPAGRMYAAEALLKISKNIATIKKINKVFAILKKDNITYLSCAGCIVKPKIYELLQEN